jgi:hypothetical protein
VVDGYKEPSIPPTNENGRKLNLNNSKAKNSLLNGLVDSIYVKFVHCNSTKNIWDKLQNVYEGDTKAKNAFLNGLVDSIYVKVMHCNTTKIILTNFRMYMKETQKSRQQSFKLTEVNLNS